MIDQHKMSVFFFCKSILYSFWYCLHSSVGSSLRIFFFTWTVSQILHTSMVEKFNIASQYDWMKGIYYSFSEKFLDMLLRGHFLLHKYKLISTMFWITAKTYSHFYFLSFKENPLNLVLFIFCWIPLTSLRKHVLAEWVVWAQ